MFGVINSRIPSRGKVFCLKHMKRQLLGINHTHLNIVVKAILTTPPSSYNWFESNVVANLNSHCRYKSSLAYDEDEDEDDVHYNGNDSKLSKETPFLLTDIGEGIHEVEVIDLYVTPGQQIRQFQNVCQVQSDKATVDITSRFDGVITEVCAVKGEMLKVGESILYIKEDCEHEVPNLTEKVSSLNSVEMNFDHELEKHSSQKSDRVADIESTKVKIKDRRNRMKILATPAVRKMIIENNIDLSTLNGTGKDGRVLKSDVLQVLKEIGKGGSQNEKMNISDFGSVNNQRNIGEGVADRVTIPIKGFNRIMVRAMDSTLKVPHMVYSDEVDVSALKQCRDDLKPTAEDKGVSLSYLPFAIKACSLAINEYPILNSSIDTETMTLTMHAQHDIGVAIDSPLGLVVPVVRNCEQKSILDIARDLQYLRQLADKGALTQKELHCPTFTMSNIGAIGGTVMSPVVLPPQVAIGAIGKIQRLPRFIGDSNQIVEAHLMNISWGGDHRVLDGGTLGRFSNVWKFYIEKPISMVCTMK